MKKVKFIDNKITMSKLNNLKTQNPENLSNYKEQNKFIKNPILINDTEKLKENYFQNELKYSNKFVNGEKKYNVKENKNEDINKNEKFEKEKNINNNKNKEIIESKDAFIVYDKEENIDNINDTKEEKDKNSYLTLSQDEINNLIKINKIKMKKSQSNDNILKNILNINFGDKTLKYLESKQKYYLNEIKKIKLQQKYLNECSLNNLSKNNLFYKNLQTDNIKNLEKSHNNIMEKLNLINQQINNINIKSDNNIKIKREYLTNANQIRLNNNKINKRLKKLRNETNLLYQKMIKDAELNLIKKNKELDLIEKEQKEKKNLEFMEKIKNSKNLEKQRSKEVKLEVLKNKPFINSTNVRGKKKNYLYMKMAKSFERREKKILSAQKRKKSKLIEENEKKENERNDYLNKKKLELIENTNNLHKIWKERSNLLPKYKSPIYQKVLYSEENIKENEKNKIENRKKLYNEKEKYSKEKIHLPPINSLLRREREKKKLDFFNNKLKNIKRTNSYLQNEKYSNIMNINEKTNNNLKEKKLIKSHSSVSINVNNKINNKKGNIIIDNYLNNKNIKNNRNPNDLNYLEELRKERLLKNENKTVDLLNNNNKEINMDIIKEQIKIMEEKYNRDKELLKVQGGYANNQELGDKMSQLLVNSIKNKLDMIENLNK